MASFKILGKNGPNLSYYADSDIALLPGFITSPLGLTINSNVADGASAIGVSVNNTVSLVNATARLISFMNNGVEKAAFLANGSVLVPTIGPNTTNQHTIPAVTSGTVVINTAAQTLTNKTIAFGSNTFTGFVAEANGGLGSNTSALTAGIFVKTGSNTYVTRSLVLGTGTTVTNGDGISGNLSVNITYGNALNTATQGNDTRLNPVPSAAGKMIYDTGSAYAETTAGTSSQVLIGGTTPFFGMVPFAALPSLVDIQIFNTPGSFTWTKPTVGDICHIIVIGGGGAGASGRRSSTGASGGGGGAAGGIFFWTMAKSSLASTESVVVGSGGTGGIAQTVNDTNGNNGGSGGTSRFGNTSFMQAQAGAGGNGGGVSSGAGGFNTNIPQMFTPQSGSAGSASSVSPGTGSSLAPGAGGGGGGWNGTVASTGGVATIPGFFGGGSITGGSIPGGNGSSSVASYPSNLIGIGGSGGGGSGTTNGGNGGNATNYGAGGGGGGGCANGFNSGAGGNGAGGIVIVYTF